MAIWSVLLACQGFTYDGPAGLMGFAPVWQPEDHRSFFTAAEGWRLFNQRCGDSGQTERIEVRQGTLKLITTVFAVAEGALPTTVVVAVGASTLPSRFELTNSAVRITLASPVTLGTGQALDVSIR
jgi:hypothetical protein